MSRKLKCMQGKKKSVSRKLKSVSKKRKSESMKKTNVAREQKSVSRKNTRVSTKHVRLRLQRVGGGQDRGLSGVCSREDWGYESRNCACTLEYNRDAHVRT